ncbi:hypothetical protein TNCV_1307301 [Trichonephila clavipes]|nr:hypothetical protein TNCV_1307301 [Trichonephila clavipes]
MPGGCVIIAKSRFLEMDMSPVERMSAWVTENRKFARGVSPWGLVIGFAFVHPPFSTLRLPVPLKATIIAFENSLPSAKKSPPVLRAVTELASCKRSTLKLISSNLLVNAEMTVVSVCKGDKPVLSSFAIWFSLTFCSSINAALIDS